MSVRTHPGWTGQATIPSDHVRSLAIPAEDPAQPGPEPEEELHGAVCTCEVLHRHEGAKVDDGAAGIASGKIDHPHVVQRYIGEQRVRSEVDSLVFIRSDAHAQSLCRCPTDLRFSCAQ